MANIQIPNLPAATALSGSELIEAVQAGVSVKVTISQLGGSLNPMSSVSILGEYNAALPVYPDGATTNIQTDANGRLILVGSGTAGTPSGGVVSVQGTGVDGSQKVVIHNALGQENSNANPLIVKAYDGDGTAALLGAVDEVAPGSDTAASGLNGRMQRIAQRITTLLTATGTVAAGAAGTISMLIGGVYRATLPTLTDGQQAAASLDTRGQLRVIIGNPDSTQAAATTTNSGDGASNAISGLRVLNFPSLFNGTNWDRVRNNNEVTLLASAARTTAQQTADQTNYNARGVKIGLDITSYTSGSLTVTLQGKDSVSGAYYTLLAGTAVSASGYTTYTLYPGVATTANVSAADILPRTWRVNVAVADASSITYSLSANVII